jgi:dienelactone hydrolase
MELQSVRYTALGESFTGELADGAHGAVAPGILVVHEGGGLTRHTREQARRLAGLGYVAFAMDLFGEREPDLEHAKAHVRRLRAEPALLQVRMQAALDVLVRHPSIDAGRLAAVGSCFGGTAAMGLARTGAPLAAVVGFHAGLTPGTPEENRRVRAKVLMCMGAADPVVTASDRQAFADAMEDAGVDWQLHVYGGVGHSFTNPDIDALGIEGFAYDAVAEGRAWRAMSELLSDVFGNSPAPSSKASIK